MFATKCDFKMVPTVSFIVNCLPTQHAYARGLLIEVAATKLIPRQDMLPLIIRKEESSDNYSFQFM